jgi:fructose-specific component phosphotransferase system IIB-like protein
LKTSAKTATRNDAGTSLVVGLSIAKHIQYKSKKKPVLDASNASPSPSFIPTKPKRTATANTAKPAAKNSAMTTRTNGNKSEDNTPLRKKQLNVRCAKISFH